MLFALNFAVLPVDLCMCVCVCGELSVGTIDIRLGVRATPRILAG